MAMNVNSLESYFPVPGVQHADETVDATVRSLAALNADARLILVSPSVSILATFDGTDPASDGRGHLYQAGQIVSMNEVTAAALRWVKAYADDADGILTISEMERI